MVMERTAAVAVAEVPVVLRVEVVVEDAAEGIEVSIVRETL